MSRGLHKPSHHQINKITLDPIRRRRCDLQPGTERHRTRLLILLCLAVAASGGCSDHATLTPLKRGDVVLAFGDSLTHGTGALPGQSYPSVLARHLGMRVVNAGVPGELSEQGLARLARELERHQPALVVLVHGGNDILQRRSLASLEASLRKMVSLSRDAGADVVLLGVPGANLGFRPPAAYRRVAEDLAVPLDESTLPKLMRDRTMKSDRVHFNGAGYARMADAIHNLLIANGAVATAAD